MTTNDILKQVESDMQKTLDAYKDHLGKIRTGRANPFMLDGIMVDYYGTPTPLNQTAQVSAPEPQMLQVKPWDKSTIPDITAAINKADLGFNPIPDAEVIRISIPPLTEDLRKDIVKKMFKELETFKVRIRNERRNGIDEAKKQDDFSEDMVKGIEKDIQTLTDKYIKTLDDMSKEKEKQLMTV